MKTIQEVLVVLLERVSEMRYLFFGAIALMVFMWGVGGATSYLTQRDVIATVTKTERICRGGEGGDCRYLVFTEQTTFENTDTIWFLKFNSSDLHGRLRDGEAYQLHVTGFRVPFMSWYPNVIRADPVPPVT